MEKILPLYKSLFSKNIHTSVPFSIIGANKDYMNWVYSECISTKYDSNYNNYTQDNWANNCPLIIRQKINKNIYFKILLLML